MEDLLRQKIQPDEKLIWNGYPRKGLMFTANDFKMVPFSLLWCGFAIFWEHGVLTSSNEKTPFFFPIFGGVFVLIGLYMVVGRFFYDSIRRDNTIYGLTNKRCIIISGVFGKTTTSVPLKSMPEIQVTGESDGAGTIILGSGNPMSNSGWPNSRSGNNVPAFECIEDVYKVEKYILQYKNT